MPETGGEATSSLTEAREAFKRGLRSTDQFPLQAAFDVAEESGTRVCSCSCWVRPTEPGACEHNCRRCANPGPEAAS